MSLINQALRKAQRDRAANRMPAPNEIGSIPMSSHGSGNKRLGLFVGLVAIVAVLVGIIVGLSIVLFKGDNSPSNKVAETPIAAPESITAPSTPIDPTITPTKATPARLPLTSVPGDLKRSAPMSPLDNPNERAEAPKPEATPTTTAQPPQPATATAPAQTESKSEEIFEWLGQAQITGVRLSDTGNRMILNGEAYSEGEIVSYQLGLTVVVIQENRILFMDDRGKKYFRRP